VVRAGWEPQPQRRLSRRQRRRFCGTRPDGTESQRLSDASSLGTTAPQVVVVAVAVVAVVAALVVAIAVAVVVVAVAVVVMTVTAAVVAVAALTSSWRW